MCPRKVCIALQPGSNNESSPSQVVLLCFCFDSFPVSVLEFLELRAPWSVCLSHERYEQVVSPLWQGGAFGTCSEVLSYHLFIVHTTRLSPGNRCAQMSPNSNSPVSNMLEILLVRKPQGKTSWLVQIKMCNSGQLLPWLLRP